MLRSGTLAVACGLLFAGPAEAETVARGVHNGMLALSPAGKPFSAYVRGTRLVVSDRARPGKWRARTAAPVSAGSDVAALDVGGRGPVVLTQSANGRTLTLVRRTGRRWHRIRLGGRLPAGNEFGRPGLAFDADGLPVVAYARWNSGNSKSRLMLARINARGRVRTVRITSEGFPQSYVPPPATPVLVKGRIHVIESYGYRTVVGTIDWYPKGPTWEGLFIDAGRGEFPVGSVFATATGSGTLFAAWSQAVFAFGALPVTLAQTGREPMSEFLLDRGLTTALTLVSRRPDVAANEWVPDDPEDIFGDNQVWAGRVLARATQAELDGRILGLAADRKRRRNVLLDRPAGLSWFRSTGRLGGRVSIEAAPQEDGSIAVHGRVDGAQSGRITLYRERFGASRKRIARPSIAGGSFSFVDRMPLLPALYRAVYTDPKTGIPYAALLRSPVGLRNLASGGRPSLPGWLGSFSPVALGGELAVP